MYVRIIVSRYNSLVVLQLGIVYVWRYDIS